MYKILITTYKAYHSIAPKYICDLITRREYKRELRTNDQMNLVVPFVKRKHFGERSFSYAAPREWNKLELSIRKSESLESFKKKKEKKKKKKLKPIFLKLHINKTCIDFGLLLSRIYIIMVSYCILYRVNYISIYTYVILLIIYVLSYTCISVTVSGYLHTLHLYFVILCFVLHMYCCDSNCIKIMLFIFTLFYSPYNFYLIHVFL